MRRRREKMEESNIPYKMGDKVIWIDKGDHGNHSIHEGDIFWIAKPSERGNYTTITSPMLEGWNNRQDPSCLYAKEKGWDCWNVPKKYLSPPFEGDEERGICFDCTYSCKKFGIEECPFYEERKVEE
jgi:hypothetical protein